MADCRRLVWSTSACVPDVSNLPPCQGWSFLGGNLGLKPQAQSYYPFGIYRLAEHSESDCRKVMIERESDLDTGAFHDRKAGGVDCGKLV